MPLLNQEQIHRLWRWDS